MNRFVVSHKKDSTSQCESGISESVERERDWGQDFSQSESDMPKNIVIFSDGTGQAGGLTPHAKSGFFGGRLSP
jgi:hypothetical protein